MGADVPVPQTIRRLTALIKIDEILNTITEYFSAPVRECEELEQSESDEQLFEHYRFVVDKGQSPLRIDRYIVSKMEQTSRHRIQLALEAQYVRVGDRPVKAVYRPGGKPLAITDRTVALDKFNVYDMVVVEFAQP